MNLEYHGAANQSEPMNANYDLIVLGSGNPGMAAAGTVRESGRSVAVIEDRDVGGTCPIRGCVPKKVLVAAAEVLSQIERAAEHHIVVNGTRLDWAALMARKQEFVRGVPEAFARSLSARGIDQFHGAAHFIGPDTVAVGSRNLSAENIVIATGSRPRELPFEGAELAITSEDILRLESLPDSFVFLGGGVIALEFAHVLARAGARVTILEAASRPLLRFDGDVVDALSAESRRNGIEIIAGVRVDAIRRIGDTIDVHYSAASGERRKIMAEHVVNGTGRDPDVTRLDLIAGEIRHSGPRIEVDNRLRSVSNPRVYVAGDALWSSAQLSPVATFEGNTVGRNILGQSIEPDYRVIPATVFSVPALATVGLTEAEAESEGIDHIVKLNDMRTWRSARMHAEPVAISKVLLEKEGGRILGAHLLGHGSSEIIHLFAFAMKHNVTASELAETVYAYPSFASDVKYLI